MKKFRFILDISKLLYLSYENKLFYLKRHVNCNELYHSKKLFNKAVYSELLTEAFYFCFNPQIENISNDHTTIYKFDLLKPNLNENKLLVPKINSFGLIFCNVNKCTSLNTFIWFNLSG